MYILIEHRLVATGFSIKRRERPENGSAKTIIRNDPVEDKRRKGRSLERPRRYSVTTDAGGLWRRTEGGAVAGTGEII